MFKLIDDTGFHITFENNVTVSVQFGKGHYCDNYLKGNLMECKNAEVAIWQTIEDEIFWITSNYTGVKESVISNVDSKELLKILNWAEGYDEM